MVEGEREGRCPRSLTCPCVTGWMAEGRQGDGVISLLSPAGGQHVGVIFSFSVTEGGMRRSEWLEEETQDEITLTKRDSTHEGERKEHTHIHIHIHTHTHKHTHR